MGLDGKNVCDLGCGPGLYALRFAARGASVIGMDFSVTSIDYAREACRDLSLMIEYDVANYLEDPLPPDQDLITMIYFDLCVLSPRQRRKVFQDVRRALRKDGVFLFDVVSMDAFHARQESSTIGRRFMNGFWAVGDYLAFLNTYKYAAERVVLDQYTIAEPHRTWQVFNWLQYFDRAHVVAELAHNGFEAIEIASDLADLSGSADQASFTVIAKPIA